MKEASEEEHLPQLAIEEGNSVPEHSSSVVEIQAPQKEASEPKVTLLKLVVRTDENSQPPASTQKEGTSAPTETIVGWPKRKSQKNREFRKRKPTRRSGVDLISKAKGTQKEENEKK